MECVAVIAEFNPFHNGHKLLCEQIRLEYPEHAIVAIMSGNTVQRGELSVFEKYARAEIAVRNGFDAVLELPFPYSCSAAEQFAEAGVYIADALGASVLAFGSESGDSERLWQCAAELLSDEFTQAFEVFIKNNRDISVVAARDIVYETVFDKKIPSTANDILALEYIKSIIRNMYPMKTYIIHRTENYRATDARNAIKHGDVSEIERLLPKEGRGKVSLCNKGLRGLSSLILGSLRIADNDDSGSGIVNALKSCAQKSGSFEGFMSLLPTKTYTASRLRREIIAYLFDLTDAIKNETPEYTVLLAASKRGTQYLSETKKRMRIPIVTRMSDTKDFTVSAAAQLRRAIKADSVYHLAFDYPSAPIPFQTPYIEK